MAAVAVPRQAILCWILVLALSLMPQLANARDTRLSSVVAFQRQSPHIQQWLANPSLAYVESYVRFDATLSESVIFGVDQEFLDGVTKPLHIKGGDWMGFVGLQRNGKVWVATGTDETDGGTPSKDRKWVILDLGEPLQPDSWYRIHAVADFAKRQHVLFSVSGPGLEKSFDLSAYKLDYPNMMPFEARVLTTYGLVMNGSALGGTADANAKVYFDDFRAGIGAIIGDKTVDHELFYDGFEDSAKLPLVQPISKLDVFISMKIALKPYADNVWYLEREEALAKPQMVGFAKSGMGVMLIDGTLKDTRFHDWVKE